MRRLVRNKLRSRTGASITFALLLFLVCAVVGSVVLAAGTAAAGRYSDLREMDARYYSVTSAAELLKAKLSEKTVTVTQVKTTVTTTETPYVNGVAGARTETTNSTELDPVFSDTDAAPQILIEAAEALKGNLAAFKETYTLTHTPLTGIDADPLQIGIAGTLSADGTLQLTLGNTGADVTDVYSLILTFSCETDRRVDRQTREDSPVVEAVSAENYTVRKTVTVTETTVTTYRWVLSDVRKAVAE